MDLRLKNKKVLITGSTKGIGFAIAKLLLEEDAEVWINGRSESSVEEGIADFSSSLRSRVHGIVADLEHPDQYETIYKELPQLDILINNAGIYYPAPFEDISDEQWLRIFSVNVMSGIRLSRHYLPKMLEQSWGRIIFISSESSINIPTEMIHYGMTKTAQLAISRGLAKLTRGTEVTVNAVLPGPTLSEGVEDFVQNLAEDEDKGLEEVEEEFFNQMRPSSLIQRFASPEEVAHLVVYISSPLSAATNGAALRVDGGVVESIL